MGAYMTQYGLVYFTLIVVIGVIAFAAWVLTRDTQNTASI